MRTLLVLTAVFALWLGIETDRARKQQEAVAALRERGYLVWYDYHFPDGLGQGFDPCAESPMPRWLPEVLREDWLCDVVMVSGGGKEVRDLDLVQMQRFPRVRDISLHMSSISDKQLAHLAKMTSLEKLHLAYTAISDEGLEHLRGLYRLRELFLNRNRVSEAGVARLQKALPECRMILVDEWSADSVRVRWDPDRAKDGDPFGP